ncbi:MAG: N-acyl homoserine lactonase family protein [Tetrasphaera sp.]
MANLVIASDYSRFPQRPSAALLLEVHGNRGHKSLFDSTTPPGPAVDAFLPTAQLDPTRTKEFLMASTGTIRHLWALEAPAITVHRSVIQLLADGDITIPSATFVIEHPRHGLLAFDTGLAIDAAGDPHHAYGQMADVFPIDFPESRRLDRQLADLGFTTGDVKRVVLSHGHWDHTGGLAHFPDAEGFVGAGELDYVHRPGRQDAAMFRTSDLDGGPQTWHAVPAGVDHDVFGDGSVVVLSLPGHTVGTLGLQLRFPDGRTFVLTGDAAHLQEALALDAGMPFDVDPRIKRTSYQRLRLLASQPDTTVWVNHDPRDWATHRENGALVI